MQQPQELVRGFAGEDRLNPSDLLPPHVSPDAINVDYAGRTIKKRQGYKRLHPVAIKKGGVRIDNSGGGTNCLITKVYSGSMGGATILGGTVEISVMFIDLPTTDVDIVSHWNSSDPNHGWRLYYNVTNDAFSFDGDIGTSDETFDSALPAAGVSVGATYHISVAVDPDNSRFMMVVNGVSETHAVATFGGISAVFIRSVIGAGNDGGTPQSQSSDMIVDEYRLWADVRTEAEMIAWQGQELSAKQQTDRLEFYYKLNTGFGTSDPNSTDYDVIPTHRFDPITFYGAGVSIVEGLVPRQGSDGFAFRGDGATTTSGTAYTTEDVLPATIYASGDTWTVELWVRLEANIPGDGDRIISIGAYDVNNGSVMELYTDDDKNLFLLHSTTTTDNNDTDDTTYDITSGTAFHVAVVRDGTSIFVYIDGELQTTLAAAAENGPDSGDTNAGITLCARRHSSNGLENVGPFTIDEVRVWSSARTAFAISQWYDRTLPDTKQDGLEAYYRFDAVDFVRNEVGELNSATPDMVVAAQSNNPAWVQGLVNQQDVQTDARVILTAPLIIPRGEEPFGEGGGTAVLAYTTPKTKEVVAASELTYYSIVEGGIRVLKNVSRSSRNSFFDWCHFQGFLIFCNGAEENQKYDGAELPTAVTIPTPTTTHVATPTGVGSGWNGVAGDYSYVYAYRNTKDGTESLIGPIVTATVAGTRDTVEITGLPTTTANNDPQVNQLRLYRRDQGATVFRYLADVDYGTTTYSDDGSDISSNDPLDTFRGHVPESRYCWVHHNRLAFANSNGASSAVYYSEASTRNFPGANVLQVDKDDGDEVTGGISAFGGSVVFKERSIHFWTGEGNTTFQVNKVVDNIGCVAGQTVVQAPAGIYFLGYDGVYLMQANTTPQYISHTQQTFFNRIDTSKKRLACGTYDPARHQYIVSFDHLDYGRVSMVYDEETQTWARWSIGFDSLAIGEHTTTNEVEVIGGRHGYAVRLWDGEQDGTLVEGDADATYNGDSISVTTTDDTLTDGAAAFPTDDDGLRGVPVLIIDSSGTIYTKVILRNTATVLFLNETIGVTGTVSYFVGGVNFYWESPWMDMGDPSVVKRWYELAVFVAESANSTITFKHKTESNETWQSTTFSGVDEFLRVLFNNRGRRLKVRFEHATPDVAAEIQSFQTMFAAKGRVA